VQSICLKEVSEQIIDHLSRSCGGKSLEGAILQLFRRAHYGSQPHPGQGDGRRGREFCVERPRVLKEKRVSDFDWDKARTVKSCAVLSVPVARREGGRF
jgi:hypothetical protein